VLGYINLLAKRNLFTANFEAKKVVRALWDEFSVKESLIPPDLQINNHLHYCCTSRLNHTNMTAFYDVNSMPAISHDVGLMLSGSLNHSIFLWWDVNTFIPCQRQFVSSSRKGQI
jgi:hypothetical protein